MRVREVITIFPDTFDIPRNIFKSCFLISPLNRASIAPHKFSFIIILSKTPVNNPVQPITATMPQSSRHQTLVKYDVRPRPIHLRIISSVKSAVNTYSSRCNTCLRTGSESRKASSIACKLHSQLFFIKLPWLENS